MRYSNCFGAGLCEEDTVQFIAENAKECVQWLQLMAVFHLIKMRTAPKANLNITSLVKVGTATANFARCRCNWHGDANLTEQRQ